MKQQLKIKIAKNQESADGVWITLPVSQKEFSRQIKDEDLQPKEIEIVSTCCNTYSLYQCLLRSKNLSKINYLGKIFSDFDKSQRVRFGSICDMFLSNSNCSIDDFINLALNIAKNTSQFQNLIIEVPPELKIRIRRQK